MTPPMTTTTAATAATTAQPPQTNNTLPVSLAVSATATPPATNAHGGAAAEFALGTAELLSERAPLPPRYGDRAAPQRLTSLEDLLLGPGNNKAVTMLPPMLVSVETWEDFARVAAEHGIALAMGRPVAGSLVTVVEHESVLRKLAERLERKDGEWPFNARQPGAYVEYFEARFNELSEREKHVLDSSAPISVRGSGARGLRLDIERAVSELREKARAPLLFHEEMANALVHGGVPRRCAHVLAKVLPEARSRSSFFRFLKKPGYALRQLLRPANADDMLTLLVFAWDNFSVSFNSRSARPTVVSTNCTLAARTYEVTVSPTVDPLGVYHPRPYDADTSRFLENMEHAASRFVAPENPPQPWGTGTSELARYTTSPDGESFTNVYTKAVEQSGMPSASRRMGLGSRAHGAASVHNVSDGRISTQLLGAYTGAPETDMTCMYMVLMCVWLASKVGDLPVLMMGGDTNTTRQMRNIAQLIGAAAGAPNVFKEAWLGMYGCASRGVARFLGACAWGTMASAPAGGHVDVGDDGDDFDGGGAMPPSFDTVPWASQETAVSSTQSSGPETRIHRTRATGAKVGGVVENVVASELDSTQNLLLKFTQTPLDPGANDKRVIVMFLSLLVYSTAWDALSEDVNRKLAQAALNGARALPEPADQDAFAGSLSLDAVRDYYGLPSDAPESGSSKALRLMRDWKYSSVAKDIGKFILRWFGIPAPARSEDVPHHAKCALWGAAIGLTEAVLRGGIMCAPAALAPVAGRILIITDVWHGVLNVYKALTIYVPPNAQGQTLIPGPVWDWVWRSGIMDHTLPKTSPQTVFNNNGFATVHRMLMCALATYHSVRSSLLAEHGAVAQAYYACLVADPAPLEEAGVSPGLALASLFVLFEVVLPEAVLFIARLKVATPDDVMKLLARLAVLLKALKHPQVADEFLVMVADFEHLRATNAPLFKVVVARYITLTPVWIEYLHGELRAQVSDGASGAPDLDHAIRAYGAVSMATQFMDEFQARKSPVDAKPEVHSVLGGEALPGEERLMGGRASFGNGVDLNDVAPTDKRKEAMIWLFRTAAMAEGARPAKAAPEDDHGRWNFVASFSGSVASMVPKGVKGSTSYIGLHARDIVKLGLKPDGKVREWATATLKAKAEFAYPKDVAEKQKLDRAMPGRIYRRAGDGSWSEEQVAAEGHYTNNAMRVLADWGAGVSPFFANGTGFDMTTGQSAAGDGGDGDDEQASGGEEDSE